MQKSLPPVEKWRRIEDSRLAGLTGSTDLTCHCHVIEIERTKRGERTNGGVSYEIDTDRDKRPKYF
ncbi:MAG TPA: hypothetical protein VNG71_09935 [Pyrinomonadaceae bacterium]|nr:hypothetical protein [Pyrinomonadaceae bacterium]